MIAEGNEYAKLVYDAMILSGSKGNRSTKCGTKRRKSRCHNTNRWNGI